MPKNIILSRLTAGGSLDKSASVMTYTYFRTNPHSAGILIPEKSRTEFIQFCDKKGFFTLTPFIRAVFLPQNTLPGFIPVLYFAYYPAYYLTYDLTLFPCCYLAALTNSSLSPRLTRSLARSARTWLPFLIESTVV